MQNILKAACAVLLAANAVWMAACERSRAPAAPSPGVAATAPAGSVSGSNEPLVVQWHCLAAAGGWQALDCPRPAPAGQHLAPRALAALTAPAAPTNLSGSVASARISLIWTAPAAGDAPTSYVVEAGSGSGLSDVASFDTGSTMTSLVADSVPPGTYYIRVRAKNSAGVSAASNELVLLVVGSGACAPANPTGLTATASGSTVTLRWTPPSSTCAATAYIVEAGSAKGAIDLANFNTGTNATSYVAANVAAGTYYVRVRAMNAAGTSSPSNEAVLVVSAAGCTGPPPPPAGLSGTVSGSLVMLTWGSVSGATSYTVEAGSAPGLSDIAVLDEGLATSLTANAASGAYYVRVRAQNSCGASAASNEIVVRVGGAAAAQ